MSIIAATGISQITYPGQKPESLATGMLFSTKPDMQILTTIGTANIQLADGSMVYVDNATQLTFVNVANPTLNQKSTILELNAGGVFVNTAHLAKGVTARVTTPGLGEAYATGQFLGATYLPNQARLDADCLVNPCHLSGANVSRDMAAGQHFWMVHGILDGGDAARWSLWTNLCDADCPSRPSTSLLRKPHLL